MKIALLGATGATGRAFTRLAIARGHRVQAVARDPSAIPNQQGLEVYPGDVRQVETLVRTVESADALLGLFGISGLRNAFAPTDLYTVGIQSVLDVMARTGRRRLVMVSSSAVLYDANAGFFWNRVLRPMMWPMYSDISLMELKVAESALDWTLVRPPQLVDGPATGRLRAAVGDTAPGWSHQVCREDLASFLLDVLERGAHVRERVVLGG